MNRPTPEARALAAIPEACSAAFDRALELAAQLAEAQLGYSDTDLVCEIIAAKIRSLKGSHRP